MSNSDVVEIVVPVHQSMNEILQALGDPEMVAINALRRYLVDICWQRIEQAERQIAQYEQNYGSDYATFKQRIGTSEASSEAANQDHPTWEDDAIEWVYRIEESQAWQKRLQKILHESRLPFGKKS